MSTGKLWWGSSNVPSGIPPNLSVGYHTTGRGLRIAQKAVGPGCGTWSCGEKRVNLTIFSRFFLDINRMPTTGQFFESQPYVLFDGHIYGMTGNYGLIDDPSAKIGIRIRQYVYSGGVYIGKSERKWPKIIDIDDEFSIQWETFYQAMQPRPFKWELDRNFPLEIDIEVRFRMYLEGTGCFGFLGSNFSGPFEFYISQWHIKEISYDEYY